MDFLVSTLCEVHFSLYGATQRISERRRAVTFLDGRAYVLRNCATNSEIAPGAELLAINTVPIGEIIQRLSRVLSGDRQPFRLTWLEGKENDRFKVPIWVVYGFRDTFDATAARSICSWAKAPSRPRQYWRMR